MSTPLEPVDSVPPQKVDPIDNLTENLQLFWFKHQKTIYACAIVIVLAIVGKGLWDWNALRVEKAIGEEYATAGESMDKLRAFASSHEGHVLAGAALLRLADDAYAAGKYADASAAYAKAASVLKESPFAGRATLGRAMSDLVSGKVADGEAALRKLAEDATVFKGLRAEAAYNLVVVSAEASRAEDVRKWCDQLIQIDGTGLWAQRAMALRASFPEAAAPVAPAAPAADAGLKLSLPPGK